MKKKVFIVNKSSHDFSPAEKFGELTFCSEGLLNRYGTNDMARQFEDAMMDSTDEDYLLPCSLNIANIVAAAILAHKHSKLNLLIFQPRTHSYMERVLILDK